jgi:hypothetical protein
MMRRDLVPVSIAVAALTTACTGGGASNEAVRTDSAGVQIVQTNGTDRPLGWTLETAFTITADDADTTGAGAFDPNDYVLESDSAGRLYVLDSQGHRVIVFGPDGKYLRSLGRKGAGPGELGFPIAFTVSRSGITSVFDVAKHRLVRFDSNGNVLPETMLGPGFYGGNLYATADELVYDYHGRTADGSTTGIFRGKDGGGVVVIETADPPTKPLDLKSCGMGFSGLPPLFAPTYRWSGNGKLLAVARHAEYDIALYDAGRLVRRIRRDVAPRPATAELAQLSLGEGMRVGAEGGERVCKPDEVVQQRGFAPTIPTIARIAFAPNGDLWVRKGGVKNELLSIDVITSDGTYLGSLPAETPFPAAFVAVDRIATVVKDELDVGRIVVYNIRK